MHAHEEDARDLTVWRRPDAELPPSRGRRAFELHEDGTAAERGPGPSDRATSAPAAWRLEPGAPPSLCIETRGTRARWRLELIEAAADRLVAREHFD